MSEHEVSTSAHTDPALAELTRLAPPSYLARVPPSHPSWRALAAAYQTPPRAYHTLAHISAVARWFAEVKARLESPAVVYAAVLFHDAIYELGPQARQGEQGVGGNRTATLQAAALPPNASNEQKSAALAEALLADVFDAADILQLKQLIHATEHHATVQVEGESDLAYFLDCDLSVLGQPRGDYARYVEQIREEYSFVPAAAFARGRAAWLSQMLGLDPSLAELATPPPAPGAGDGDERSAPTNAVVALPADTGQKRVFATDYFEGKLGSAARANLHWELSQLLGAH